MKNKTPFFFFRLCGYILLTVGLVCFSGGCRYASAAQPFETDIADDLQQAIESVRTEQNIPAVSVLIIASDRFTWEGVCGFTDIENAVPATHDSLFSIGSLTKTFMAVLALKLAEEGALHLDDPIEKWLPDLPVFAARRINPSTTVRQLMNHTSGIASYTDCLLTWLFMAVLPDHRWRQNQVVRLIGFPRFQPGESWGYSNSNYYLLGMILENASGTSVSKALERNLFAPLQLNRTFLDGEETVPFCLAKGYSRWGNELILDPLSVKRTGTYSLAWTAGALVSSAGDVTRFSRSVFTGDFLSPNSLSEMLDWVPTGTGDNGYGLGIARVNHPEHGLMWVHDGAINGFGARLVYLPEPDMSIAVLININLSRQGELDAVTDAISAVIRRHGMDQRN